jgi:glycosyltransferase involved in cell wall biosynthesis
MTPPRAAARGASIVVFATRYPPAFRGGGPIRTLEALVRSAPATYDVRVVTRDTDQGDPTPLPVVADVWSKRDGIPVRYSSVGRLRSLASAMEAVRSTHAELLYVNSFFDLRLSIMPQLLRKLGYLRSDRLLVAPRGEFGIAAISSKSRKKNLFLMLYRVLGLHRGVVWHVSSSAEKADVERVWGPSAQVVVRENDTLLPPSSDRSGISDEANDRPLALVSVGRLVEHKGLHLVLEGLLEVPAPTELDVYGPAEDEPYMERCRALVEHLPSHVTVRFHEALPHEAVRRTMWRYDALVMPTAGENFGHVIAEALSVACPVVCSDTTPWSDTLRRGGGVVVPDRTVASWRTALEGYAKSDANERINRRARAGVAYDEWKAKSSCPHVFDLVLGQGAGDTYLDSR